MKVYLTSILLALSLTTYAQVRDISVLAGVNVPLYKGIESDAVIAVNYSQFYHKGLGFRIGAQWSPSVADIDNSFGLPVSFAYRTKSRTTREKLQSGAAGSVHTMDYGPVYGEADDRVRNMAGGFLMNLFSDMEFFIGITPGYVSGTSSNPSKMIYGSSLLYREESWTDKKNAISVSIDAGMCLNYSIWRFDIKVMPAFHYNLTANYIYNKSTVEEDIVVREYTRPLHWFFSLSGGIAYRIE